MAGASGLVLGVGGAGQAVVSGLGEDLRRVDPFRGLADRPETARGTNILVVGTDSRATVTPEQQREYQLGGSACDCADTIMLVHLSADRDRVSVISIPRDSYAELPAHRDRATGEHHAAHPQKINAAFAHGGPRLTVRTVEQLTGLRVDHYLEVDFAGFMRAVDALGGVEVCTARPLRDPKSGLDLPAGVSTVNGGEALRYVRARNLDGAADLGRMQRQQRLVASVIDEATDGGVLMNPVRLGRVTSALLDSVRADPGFGGRQMLALGRALRGLTPASSEFTSVPIEEVSHPVPGVGATVTWDREAARELFAAVREDRPLAGREPGRAPGSRPVVVDVAPGEIRVHVENGTSRTGLARRTDRALRATGFTTTGAPSNAARQDVRRTVITYDPVWNRSARSLAAALPGAELRKAEGLGPLLRVTVGADHPEVRPVRAVDPMPEPATPQQGGYAAVTGDRVTCAS